ncbi:MAG TPA: glycoside hydrolase 100 family protein [Acidiferrobacterales bacterium]
MPIDPPSPDTEQQLLTQAHDRALDVLRANLTPHGILAARRTAHAEERHYTRLFARDAGVCALAMGLSRDADLVGGARAALLTLADHQADNGQIPKFVDPEQADSDFWYLGCIDATLWWLIAAEFLKRHAPDPGYDRKLDANVERALTWLGCQEHPRLYLLQQNEASDWADVMPRSGFVLYSNALWYHVKRRYGLPHQADTLYHFNHLFYPFSRHVPNYRRLRLLRDYVRNRSRDTKLYLSFVNFSFWGEEGDVLGNLLAVLVGLATEQPARNILDALVTAGVDRPYPARAVCAPIAPDHPQWRLYMERHDQNYAWQYHNGGIWPLIGGFWVLALAAQGDAPAARAALVALARLNRANDWEFNEWFHGRTGEPLGMPGQSWSAAMYLLAEAGMRGNVF